jgi:hypothetical protein
VLRSLAQDWNTMAASLENQVTALNQAVSAVGADEWSGSAADAFHQHWQTQSAEVQKGLANFKQVASSLDSYAGTVDSINEEILSAAEQILVASVAGAVLAFVSDAVAANNTKCGKMALTIGKDLASNFVADSAANVGSSYLSGQNVTLGADLGNERRLRRGRHRRHRGRARPRRAGPRLDGHRRVDERRRRHLPVRGRRRDRGVRRHGVPEPVHRRGPLGGRAEPGRRRGRRAWRRLRARRQHRERTPRSSRSATRSAA